MTKMYIMCIVKTKIILKALTESTYKHRHTVSRGLTIARRNIKKKLEGVNAFGCHELLLTMFNNISKGVVYVVHWQWAAACKERVKWRDRMQTTASRNVGTKGKDSLFFSKKKNPLANLPSLPLFLPPFFLTYKVLSIVQ